MRQPAGASLSARARAIAPVRGRGQRRGRKARGQERQRQKETKVQRQLRRRREGDAGRQTDRHERAYTHTRTHTHTRRQSQREGDTERLTERRKAGDRHGREDGIRSETDTLAQTVTPRRERLCGSSGFPKGGGVSFGPGGQRLDAVPWGWQSPVGTPGLLRSRGLKGPLRLGYLRRDPAPAPRPEGECVRVCV